MGNDFQPNSVKKLTIVPIDNDDLTVIHEVDKDQCRSSGEFLAIPGIRHAGSAKAIREKSTKSQRLPVG
jgi:hypothetical protein